MSLPQPDLKNRTLAEGEHCGYPWIVVHNNIGFRCGYICLSSDHPWFGKDYDHIPADVHGGLTYASGTEMEWWIGFDCAHCGDAPDSTLPNRGGLMRPFATDTIKDTAYVKAECLSLCQQAKEAAA